MPLFGRWRNRTRAKTVRLFYASDIHGTEVLWRKFLNAGKAYSTDALIMGGDLTGKAVIPLVNTGEGYRVELFGETQILCDEAEIEEIERQIRGKGMYPHRMTQDEVERVSQLSSDEREEWFSEVMLESFSMWLDLAGERLDGSPTRCFVMPGNDDPPSVGEAIERSEGVESCEGIVVEFDGYSMISILEPYPVQLAQRALGRRDLPAHSEDGRRGSRSFKVHLQPAPAPVRLQARHGPGTR
jgi:Icc-related predicted phosphoesterase